MTTHCVKVRYVQNVEFSSLSSSTCERERERERERALLSFKLFEIQPNNITQQGGGLTSQDHQVLHEFANIESV
jgi:hypothetical protein